MEISFRHDDAGVVDSGMRLSRRFGRGASPASAVLLALLLGGCSFGRVDYIEEVTTSATSHCDLLRNVCGTMMGQPIEFKIKGVGNCTLGKLDFGDGQSTNFGPFDFGQTGALRTLSLTHTYQGWPGPKTVTAEGVTNCVGKATRSMRLFKGNPNTSSANQQALVIGFSQRTGTPATTCTPVQGVAPLRRNTVVGVKTNPDPNVRINFGCPFSGCVYNADGEANSVAPNQFPFPGLRKYSLVLRIGTQIVQGGTNMSFTTSQTGPLEICVNDDVLHDNNGAWGIEFLVDESNAL